MGDNAGETFLRIAPPVILQVLYLSPLLAVREIWKRKGVDNKSFLPFICTFANASVWVLYGLLQSDYTVAIPNITGIVVGLISSIVYHRFATKKPVWVASLAIIIVGVSIVLGLTLERSVGAQVVGIIGNVLGVLLLCSPLATVAQVIKTKSTASMPFAMSIAVFFNALSWVLYGVIVSHDILVWLPNALGTAAATLQLLLFAIYGRADASAKESKRAKEGSEAQDFVEGGLSPCLESAITVIAPLKGAEEFGSTVASPKATVHAI